MMVPSRWLFQMLHSAKTLRRLSRFTSCYKNEVRKIIYLITKWGRMKSRMCLSKRMMELSVNRTIYSLRKKCRKGKSLKFRLTLWKKLSQNRFDLKTLKKALFLKIERVNQSMTHKKSKVEVQTSRCLKQSTKRSVMSSGVQYVLTCSMSQCGFHVCMSSVGDA